MNASFATALNAANEAAAGQHYPQGALYVVATPIGNLADITLRALHVLQLADAVACEDTRHTHSLLQAYGIEHSPADLLAVHQHNEAQSAQVVLQRLQTGQRVVYVSDAGTPAVSDPGARLVAVVRQAGMPVVPVPGVSSITTLLSASGALSQGESNGFVFIGFLPSKAAERLAAVQALMHEPRAVLLLEAPHRIEALASALAALGDRQLSIGRELTKQFEEIAQLGAQQFSAWLDEKPQRKRGEFTLLLHSQSEPQPNPGGSATGQRLLELLMPELPLKTAVRLAAQFSAEPRNALYQAALALKQTQVSGSNDSIDSSSSS